MFFIFKRLRGTPSEGRTREDCFEFLALEGLLIVRWPGQKHQHQRTRRVWAGLVILLAESSETSTKQIQSMIATEPFVSSQMHVNADFFLM